jgi:hypothetical protein
MNPQLVLTTRSNLDHLNIAADGMEMMVHELEKKLGIKASIIRSQNDIIQKRGLALAAVQKALEKSQKQVLHYKAEVEVRDRKLEALRAHHTLQEGHREKARIDKQAELDMSTQKRPVINPRLTATVKRKRKLAANLLAFQQCEKALHGFDIKTQTVALRATAALLGITLG